MPDPAQLDSNGDGFGNICDADLNNDDIINFLDLSLFSAAFLTTDADADFNGDGVVNFLDLVLLQGQMFMSPGPGAVGTAPPAIPVINIISDQPGVDFDGDFLVDFQMNAATFNLIRTRSGQVYEEIELTGITESSYEEIGLPIGNYTYEVQACNAQGSCSEYSAPVSLVREFNGGGV